MNKYRERSPLLLTLRKSLVFSKINIEISKHLPDYKLHFEFPWQCPQIFSCVLSLCSVLRPIVSIS